MILMGAEGGFSLSVHAWISLCSWDTAQARAGHPTTTLVMGDRAEVVGVCGVVVLRAGNHDDEAEIRNYE